MSTDVTQSEAPPAGDRWRFFRARTLSRWPARLLSLAGVGLIVVSLTGWWLTTRVLSDEGFGDVVAKTLQQQPVRNYIADQATLKFAKSNKLVTAARPVVSKAVADALVAPGVTEAVHAFAAGLHKQLLQINSARRTNVAAATATATATIRNTGDRRRARRHQPVHPGSC